MVRHQHDRSETVQKLGVYVPDRGMSAGGAMRWRVVLELAGADGTRQMHEIDTGVRSPSGHTAATLGLGFAEGKAALAAMQRRLVAAQVDEQTSTAAAGAGATGAGRSAR